MRTSEAFPSDYLKASDINETLNVTIESVEMVEIGQGRDKESKLLIKFVGQDKGLICNKTNAGTIEKITGTDETDEWVGKNITLCAREVEFQGDMVMAIRVSLKAPGAAGKKIGAKISESAGEDDDAVTEFWTEVKKQGVERKQALEFVSEQKGDFAKATELLKSGKVPF